MSDAVQFIRIDNNKISRFSDEKIDSLSSLGLYQMISAFLSNPSFKTSYGGFKQLLMNHCKNGRHSFNKCWNDLKESGYVKRTRIPSGIHEFHDYYELLSILNIEVPAVVNLSFNDGLNYLKKNHTFLPPKQNFTKISYKMLMDERLSLTAKGLFAVITRLVNISLNTKDLILTKELIRRESGIAIRCFNTALKQLKETGYLE